MTTALLYRYRVPFARRVPLEPLAAATVLEHLFVYAPDAESARRQVWHLTHAAAVFEPERLHESLPAEPQPVMGAGGGFVVFG